MQSMNNICRIVKTGCTNNQGMQQTKVASTNQRVQQTKDATNQRFKKQRFQQKTKDATNSVQQPLNINHFNIISAEGLIIDQQQQSKHSI